MHGPVEEKVRLIPAAEHPKTQVTAFRILDNGHLKEPRRNSGPDDSLFAVFGLFRW